MLMFILYIKRKKISIGETYEVHFRKSVQKSTRISYQTQRKLSKIEFVQDIQPVCELEFEKYNYGLRIKSNDCSDLSAKVIYNSGEKEQFLSFFNYHSSFYLF